MLRGQRDESPETNQAPDGLSMSSKSFGSRRIKQMFFFPMR